MLPKLFFSYFRTPKQSPIDNVLCLLSDRLHSSHSLFLSQKLGYEFSDKSIPYKTKQKSFQSKYFKKNNPASLPISSMMIVFWTQYVYTISQCGIILISLTQRSTNTIPLQVGINRLSVVLLGYNIISLSFVRTRIVIQSVLPSEIVVGLTIYRTQKSQFFNVPHLYGGGIQKRYNVLT